jgi:hypothetical protein
MTDSEELDRYRAPALDKGLDILELLAGEEEGLSQAEIAKALGRTPNELSHAGAARAPRLRLAQRQ